MLLSVLSALARLDIDPWQEAAKLARLPGETATQRLAALIAELPDEPSADPDPVTIAARLIALLPRPTDRNIPSRKACVRRRCSDPSSGRHVHVCDRYGIRAGLPMDRSKPSTGDAGRQRSCAGLQHRFPTTGATAECWPVTINWPGVTARSMTDDKMQPNLSEQLARTKPEQRLQPVRQRAERPPRLGGAGGPGIGRDATLPQLKDHFAEATMLFISEHGAICWTAAGPCEHHVNVRVAVWQILNQT